MKYEIVEKNGCEIKIRVTLTNEVFKQAVDAAFQKNKAKYTIPGFRKGKAPRSVLEKHLGAEVFYEDAINILLPEYYEKALKELNIDPVARPDVDIEQVSPNEDFIFSAVVTVAPEFELEGYKGLEVEKIDTTITDEILDAEIEKSRKQNARILTIENEPAQMGDTVTLDYSGSVDGVKFDGGTAEGHQLKLGSGMFIPGFEDQLVGLNIGQDSVVTVTFPEQYHAENLAGKEAKFDVVIRSIERE
ncbi:MAG: trigger factor [Bacillota bacterium]|nr:trigger factor [Bacillota bacterium]